ncbi:hypothetical protein L1887_01927 [Cichorium endivia]|nr:hypothetical protein L1887_01927 [Cichorium endivia]
MNVEVDHDRLRADVDYIRAKVEGLEEKINADIEKISLLVQDFEDLSIVGHLDWVMKTSLYARLLRKYSIV